MKLQYFNVQSWKLHKTSSSKKRAGFHALFQLAEYNRFAVRKRLFSMKKKEKKAFPFIQHCLTD